MNWIPIGTLINTPKPIKIHPDFVVLLLFIFLSVYLGSWFLPNLFCGIIHLLPNPNIPIQRTAPTTEINSMWNSIFIFSKSILNFFAWERMADRMEQQVLRQLSDPHQMNRLRITGQNKIQINKSSGKEEASPLFIWPSPLQPVNPIRIRLLLLPKR